MKIEIDDKLLKELEKAVVWEDGFKLCGRFPTINGEVIDYDKKKSSARRTVEALIRSVTRKGGNNVKRD